MTMTASESRVTLCEPPPQYLFEPSFDLLQMYMEFTAAATEWLQQSHKLCSLDSSESQSDAADNSRCTINMIILECEGEIFRGFITLTLSKGLA